MNSGVISLPDFTEGLVNLEVPADVCASTYSITPQDLQQPHWPYIGQFLAACETLDGSLDFSGQLTESQLALVSLMIFGSPGSLSMFNEFVFDGCSVP